VLVRVSASKLIPAIYGGTLYTRPHFFGLLLPIAALGCNQLGLRTGPTPVLDPAAVKIASSNQTLIINALADDASDSGVFIDGTDRYYRIAEAGFNYVDDQCQAYFDQLFFIDRGRSQIKSGLAAAGATTAAILGLTNASTLSMAIVASAFGFASNATDILAGTYLYSLPPATTQGLVTKLQDAYRDQALKMRAEINTPTAAYHHVQSYLALCLPPRIEAEVVNTVSAASVNVVKGGSGSTFSVGSGGPPVNNIRPIVLLNSAQKPLPATNPKPPNQLPPAVFNDNEWFISQSSGDIIQIQKTVCVAHPDGILGGVDSPTRLNIVAFFDGLGKPRPDINELGKGLTAKDKDKLDDAFVHTTNKEGCLDAGFKDAKMVGERSQ
jgi:hypothetical protein